MFTYIKSEPELWTVGHYGPDGNWSPESDHDSRADAADRVSYLNGRKADPEDLLEIHVPRHTVGVDVKQHHLGDQPMSPPFLDVWCSCGWRGDPISVSYSVTRRVSLDDIPAAALEEAARSWRFHVRLSNRLHRVDKKLRRRRAARADEEEE